MPPGLTILSALILLAQPVSAEDKPGTSLQRTYLTAPASVTYLQQNWTEQDRQWFYYINQGSKLLPYDVFLHLEQADKTALLRAPENMLRYGFLPGKKSARNPDGLAIGISRAGESMGLTCAACHTQAIRYNNILLHIDGGQAMLDLQLFLQELEASLAATLADQPKLQRLGAGIHGPKVTPDELAALRQQLEMVYEDRRRTNQRDHSNTPYGYTRLDAFGAILNKALLLTQAKGNYNEPNAPASYPYLWDTPQHDYVEWNGSQSNAHVGALARNIGEVIGVFGQMETTPVSFLGLDLGYRSSIAAANLRKIETHISTLQSPLWPDFFPPIDPVAAARGRPLYETYCLRCHQDIDRADPGRLIKVRMSTLDEINTDPLMARNALEHRGKSGLLEGRPRYYVSGEPLAAEAPAIFMLNNLMVGVLKNNPLQSYLAKRDSRRLGHAAVIHPPKYVNGAIIAAGEEVSDRALLAYKARPLNGIWSSAPFLHNGSVPNLYELLLPAAKRSKQFYLGSWEYDPVKVGYVQQAQPGAFLFDTRLPGNSHAGHEYGSGYDGLPALSDADIHALLAYLKTL